MKNKGGLSDEKRFLKKKLVFFLNFFWFVTILYVQT